MAIEMLSYRQLGERLGCSRDAARAWVKQQRVPCHKAKDGRALVSVDLTEINHTVMPSRSPAFQDSATALLEPIEAKLEPATDYRADFERERLSVWHVAGSSPVAALARVPPYVIGAPLLL